MNRDAKILILGAGPAGLSAAYFLRRHGFTNVTLFEKLARVGGMCRSITEHQHAFELGAWVISPDHREVLQMARAVGAPLERLGGGSAFTLDDATQSARIHNLLEYVIGGSSWSARLRFARLCLRYSWLRFRLRNLFHSAGWVEVGSHPEVCVTFSAWLRAHNLRELSRLFELAITSFGYGALEEIPAPYALKYMTVRTTMAGMLSLAPLARWLPKRHVLQCFSHGFQRFWEQVAWDLDVRLGIDVQRLERRSEGIEVIYTAPREKMEAEAPAVEEHRQFDYLVITCPLIGQQLSKFCDLDEEESCLSAKLQFTPNVVASLRTTGLEFPTPLVVQVPPPRVGEPILLSQPCRESDVIGCLARCPEGTPADEHERQLRKSIERCVTALGGKVVESSGWHTFDVWPYFKHVGVDEFRHGYFERWERLQGKHRTFYAGGLFDFDDVDGTIRYSRHLVERYFARPSADVSDVFAAVKN